MSYIKDTFFGGAEQNAADAQVRSLEAAQDTVNQAAETARADAIPLFEAAMQNQQQGFQGALDIFGQTVPAQMQAFQGGNMAGQNTLLAGLGQQQNALLGNQINNSALQPYQQQLPDFSMFQQQLPQQTTIADALGTQGQMGPQQWTMPQNPRQGFDDRYNQLENGFGPQRPNGRNLLGGNF